MLRSALTLSVLTGKSVRIDHIRAGRRKPGLMAQHLMAVEGARSIASARVEGAHPGSTTLLFEPGGLRPGRYSFDIGTAGSAPLVLQTLLVPLALGSAPSQVRIVGGTHVPWSPCHHYLELQWLPALRRIGLQVELELKRAGFYPRGGGEISASIPPAGRLSPLRLVERGRLEKLTCLSAAANLPESVAERQSGRVLQRLAGKIDGIEVRHLLLDSPGKGTLLLLLGEFERSRCCYFALGERGKPAEGVADEAVDALDAFLATDGAVDEFLVDQLLLPLALARGESEIRTPRVTGHLLTNGEIIRRFLPAGIAVEGEIGRPGTVRVEGKGVPG